MKVFRFVLLLLYISSINAEAQYIQTDYHQARLQKEHAWKTCETTKVGLVTVGIGAVIFTVGAIQYNHTSSASNPGDLFGPGFGTMLSGGAIAGLGFDLALGGFIYDVVHNCRRRHISLVMPKSNEMGIAVHF